MQKNQSAWICRWTLFNNVISNPALKGWSGFRLVVQAYQKRATSTLQWLIALAESLPCRIPVRLVKGAYWDSEIKRAQVNGLEGYPVFTQKLATDGSYLACAKLILSNSHALYPQFATHNAHTVAAILDMGKITLATSFSTCMAWVSSCMHHY